jgi:hypothetical protein
VKSSGGKIKARFRLKADHCQSAARALIHGALRGGGRSGLDDGQDLARQFVREAEARCRSSLYFISQGQRRRGAFDVVNKIEREGERL